MLENYLGNLETHRGAGGGSVCGLIFFANEMTAWLLKFYLAKDGIGPPERDDSNIVFCYVQHKVNESTIFHKVWWNKIMVSD